MRRALVTTLLVLGVGQSPVGQAPLVPVRTIVLPGVEGRIDHLSVDLDQNRLFIAALGNNSVEVVDLRSGAHTKSIGGFHEPQGIQVVPGANSVAVATATWIKSSGLAPGTPRRSSRSSLPANGTSDGSRAAASHRRW